MSFHSLLHGQKNESREVSLGLHTQEHGRRAWHHFFLRNFSLTYRLQIFAMNGDRAIVVEAHDSEVEFEFLTGSQIVAIITSLLDYKWCSLSRDFKSKR